MTFEILFVFLILFSALILFFTGWVRMDIVALLVLGVLALSGLVTPAEALAGFSNPAVVTVWAMFILSAALYQTGVARIIGRQVIFFAGNTETRMVFAIMIISGLLSAVMNNIGVAALMLPVVMDIARTTGRPPSRLLMPLAYGSLLGGLTTLIGTPPNLLVSFALQDAGHAPFKLLDFTPVGLGVMIGGILFMALVGRLLLPVRDVSKNGNSGVRSSKSLPTSYELHQRTFNMKIKPDSWLPGKTLAESRLRAALGINVLWIKRDGGGTIMDPGPDTVIRAKDTLFVQGRLDTIHALKGWTMIAYDEEDFDLTHIDFSDLNFFEAVTGTRSPLAGQNPDSLKRFDLENVKILALKREGIIRKITTRKEVIQVSDTLLIHCPPEQIEVMEKKGMIETHRLINHEELISVYKIQENIFAMQSSQPTQQASSEMLREAYGLDLLGVLLTGQNKLIQNQKEDIEKGTRLLVYGNNKDLPLLRGLKEIEFSAEQTPSGQSLETGDVMMAELVLAPRSILSGKTLREINFRKKYGVTVLAIWSQGRAFRTNLHNRTINFGEALLVYGKRDKLKLIGSEPDFILLTDTIRQEFRTHKALTATLIMAAILIPVLAGLTPLAITAVVGIALMVLSGCLKMEEAYRAIEWKSVFLIAGLLPLGTAMYTTGAASLMAESVVEFFGPFGPWGIISGLYLLTLISTLAIPPSALVVIMSPIALQAASSFEISPHTVMMAVAIAAAGSFLSPISHPANLLVMGPGGYRFTDYIKVGIPLSLVIMLVVLLLLPIFWPL